MGRCCGKGIIKAILHKFKIYVHEVKPPKSLATPDVACAPSPPTVITVESAVSVTTHNHPYLVN
jgi:hypothetical protein